jgi:hypothetical protein
MTKEEAKKFLRENGFCDIHGVKLKHGRMKYDTVFTYCHVCAWAADIAKYKQEEKAIDKKAEQARRVLGL